MTTSKTLSAWNLTYTAKLQVEGCTLATKLAHFHAMSCMSGTGRCMSDYATIFDIMQSFTETCKSTSVNTTDYTDYAASLLEFRKNLRPAIQIPLRNFTYANLPGVLTATTPISRLQTGPWGFKGPQLPSWQEKGEFVTFDSLGLVCH